MVTEIESQMEVIEVKKRAQKRTLTELKQKKDTQLQS